jgi:hypothetical protein
MSQVLLYKYYYNIYLFIYLINRILSNDVMETQLIVAKASCNLLSSNISRLAALRAGGRIILS